MISQKSSPLENFIPHPTEKLKKTAVGSGNTTKI
jgi:hypothetical protein